MAKKNDALKETIARVVLREVVQSGAIGAALQTLAEIATPPRAGEKSLVPSAQRVQAAKTIVDFTAKFIGEAGELRAGSDLLKELETLTGAAEDLGGDDGAAEPE